MAVIKQITLGMAPTIQLGSGYVKPSASIVLEIEDEDVISEVVEKGTDILHETWMKVFELEAEVTASVMAAYRESTQRPV